MEPPRTHRYQLEGCIGQGGVGDVFRAYDPQLHRRVALKRLHLQGSAGETYALALREAMHLASLQHPHIVSVYDVGEDERGPFLVMELVGGETLEEVVEREAFSLEDFLLLARQSLDALAAAHHIGLLHRDLKPANVMLKWGLTSRFDVKLVDFGLAKFAPRVEAEHRDQAFDGSVFGSVHFMAPEQFERDRPADARTDLYSLGCLFYYALTAAYPFLGETVGEVVENHLEHRVAALTARRPDLPAALCDWVLRLLARRPKDRPDTALRAFEDLKSLAAAPAPLPPAPRAGGLPIMPWRSATALLATALLAATAGAAWRSHQSAPPVAAVAPVTAASRTRVCHASPDHCTATSATGEAWGK